MQLQSQFHFRPCMRFSPPQPTFPSSTNNDQDIDMTHADPFVDTENDGKDEEHDEDYENEHGILYAVLRSLSSSRGDIYLRRPATISATEDFMIGRSDECDIQVNWPGVSKRHCIIHRVHESKQQRHLPVLVEYTSVRRDDAQYKFYIMDVSTNGVRVNGRQVGKNNRKELREGFQIIEQR